MATDFLTAEEKTLIVADFGDLINDPEVGVDITYEVFVSKGAFNPSTGQVTLTFTSFPLRAFRSALRDREIAESGGLYQSGDVRYLIRRSDVVAPKKDDRIIDGIKTRYVIEVGTDVSDTFHAVVGRNLSGI